MTDTQQSRSAIRNLQSQIGYNFCTYFDRNYLTRGLALYESLRQHCQRPFVLWVLCFDDETYDILARLNLSGVRLISQQEFEAGDAGLARAKADRSRVEYYWTCTPSLPLYVLRCNPEVELITYLDADLYFYNDPQPIYDELGGGSILIIEHRYAPEHARLAVTSGIYNVGWMSFRRDGNGLACLQWWRERCLEWCYAHYEDGKFGDQLYLDDWPQRFRGVVILRHKGAGLAPWNLSRYSVRFGTDAATVDAQPLIFYHFHGYRMFNESVIEPAGHIYRISASQVVHLYLPYVRVLSDATAQMGLQPREVQDAASCPPQQSLVGLLEGRYLLTRSRVLALLLWRIGGWRRTVQDRLAVGFAAYARGDLSGARRALVAASLRNPFILRNLGVVSVLLESWLGTDRMNRYRQWRRAHLSY